MSISRIFIARPVMTVLVMATVLIFGVASYVQLPTSDLPNVDFPTIQVTANLPGASPDTMAAAIATPLEKQFSTIAGVSSMSSASALGTTSITLQFDLSRNIDSAAADVQSAIAAATRQLPPNMPSPPTYQKVNPADSPILFLALSSPTLPLPQLDEYAETNLAQRISMVSGVAQVQVNGAQKYAVRIQLDPLALASRGLSIDDVGQAIQAGNVNLPTGVIDGAFRAYTVKATGQLDRAPAYGPLIVAYRNGAPVHVSDVGRAIDSVENNKTAAWMGDDRAIVLSIQRQPGTNTVKVSHDVQALLPRFRRELPGSVALGILYDRAASIRDSVADVKGTLVLALVLVVLVIFAFLRDLRATLVPSVALPLSLIGTFIVMGALGFSLDNLSLMALTLSVGFVVNDAIVMLENIVRHVELGKDPRRAAEDGAKEIGFTIISMTLSLSAVFLPVLFMGGILGRLFHEFAITIGAAILISGAIALSLTPLLASRILKREHVHRPHGRLYQLSERGFDAALRFYSVGLRWSLRHPFVILGFSGVVLALTAVLFVSLPKGLFPNEDTGRLNATTEAVQGISFDDMVRHQEAAKKIVLADPNVAEVMSSAGARGASGSNNGNLFIRLKDRRDRALTADEVVQELRQKLLAIPGLRVYVNNPPPIQLGGRVAKSQYQITLQGTDTAELFRVAPRFEAQVRDLPGLLDVTTDLLVSNPELRVIIDRDRAATLGVSSQAIETVLFDAYATRQISTIYAPNNTYQVILELLPAFQRTPESLGGLYVRSATGAEVPLASVAHVEQGVGPLTIAHNGQLPAVTVSFNLAPGTSLGTAVAEVQRLAGRALPQTITTSLQGTAQAFQASLQGLGWLLALSVLVIYVVLGILYESFIHPLTILSALPFAGFGALVTLLIFGLEIDIYAFVGVIMLVGLVKKNGIMMVDFAIEARKAGKSAHDAIYEACQVRFRPIMMTTMAALLGTLPIALGLGAGAESRRPLGLAVVGGLLFSQMLTLYVTPVFYELFERIADARAARHSAKRTASPMLSA